jgi:hypothetical protein
MSDTELPTSKIALAVQNYNFGNGWIAWAVSRGGWSEDNALEFQRIHSGGRLSSHPDSSGPYAYGNAYYVLKVWDYFVGSDSGSIVIEARKHLGKPYQWGASGPYAFDCSGLTQYCYRQATRDTIPRSSAAQAAAFKAIDKDDLAPGDLIFFGTPVHHVGIFSKKQAGKLYMIHAPSTGDVVKEVVVTRTDVNKYGRWEK